MPPAPARRSQLTAVAAGHKPTIDRRFRAGALAVNDLSFEDVFIVGRERCARWVVVGLQLREQDVALELLQWQVERSCPTRHLLVALPPATPRRGPSASTRSPRCLTHHLANTRGKTSGRRPAADPACRAAPVRPNGVPAR